MKGMSHDDKQRESARESDVKKGHQSERVSSVERVGSHGSGGVSFPLHEHPDKSVVSKGKLG